MCMFSFYTIKALSFHFYILSTINYFKTTFDVSALFSSIDSLVIIYIWLLIDMLQYMTRCIDIAPPPPPERNGGGGGNSQQHETIQTLKHFIEIDLNTTITALR